METVADSLLCFTTKAAQKMAVYGRVSVLLIGVAALLSSAVHSLPAETEEEMMRAVKSVRAICQPKSGATDEQLTLLSQGSITEARELKCYIGCVLVSYDTLTDGKVDQDKMRALAEKMPESKKETFLLILSKCKDAGGADECEVGYNYITCAKKTVGEVLHTSFVSRSHSVCTRFCSATHNQHLFSISEILLPCLREPLQSSALPIIGKLCKSYNKDIPAF
nr:odorant-binding protein [Odontothrips loti]